MDICAFLDLLTNSLTTNVFRSFFSLFFLLEHFSDVLPLLPPAIGQMTGAYGLSASLCTSA